MVNYGVESIQGKLLCNGEVEAVAAAMHIHSKQDYFTDPFLDKAIKMTCCQPSHNLDHICWQKEYSSPTNT